MLFLEERRGDERFDHDGVAGGFWEWSRSRDELKRWN